MIHSVRGNLLNAHDDALINTVNCVGVMGKGIAMQFKRRWPEMFNAYASACATGAMQIGKMHIWPTFDEGNPQYIINFPTKKHWRDPSQLAYIDSGLADLVNVISGLNITSIAIPLLG